MHFKYEPTHSFQKFIVIHMGIPSVPWTMFNTPTFACFVLLRDIKIHVWRCSIQNPTFACLVLWKDIKIHVWRMFNSKHLHFHVWYCGGISKYMCGGCSIHNPRIFMFSIVEGYQDTCVEDVQFKTPHFMFSFVEGYQNTCVEDVQFTNLAFSYLVLWRDIKLDVWRMFNSKLLHFHVWYCGGTLRYMCGGCSIQNPHIFSV